MKKLFTIIGFVFLFDFTIDAQTGGINNCLRSVFFTDVNTGYAVGNKGTILKTINGGSNWIEQSSKTISNLYSVYFIGNTGYVVGDSSSYIGIILNLNYSQTH